MIRVLKENMLLKLLSLVVAILLWLATVGDPEVTTSLFVPVQYRNPPASLEISSELINSAYVEVKGSSGRLTGSNMANAVVLVDLARERRTGERTFTILADSVKLPPGVTFLRAVPSQIRLKLEARVMRDVPVVVRYAASPADGYHIARQEVIPSRVRIVGPEGRVNAIDKVQTDPIALSVEEEQSFEVHPFAGDPQVRLERSDLMIRVKVGLEKIR